MSNKTLEDFSKAALVEFIKKSFYFGRSAWVRELEVIEMRLKIHSALDKTEKLIAEQRELTGIDQIDQWLEVDEKITANVSEVETLQADYRQLIESYRNPITTQEQAN